MKPQTFNRTEKKDEKLTKQEKAYNFVQKMKIIAEKNKKTSTVA